MDVNSLSWYVDAWSVRDGAIFVTRRGPGATTENGTNTVFICMPDLQSVPVGRRSTALAATRRHFQNGLTNLDTGEEIAFNDLEQVRELVRRGFLAGGLGPAGPADTEPPPPTGGGDDRDERGGGGAYYEAQIEIIRDEYGPIIDTPWTDGTDPASDLKASVRQITDLVRAVQTNPEARYHSATGALLQLVSAFARAIRMDWDSRVSRTGEVEDARQLADWNFLMAAIGLVDDDHDGYLFWRSRLGRRYYYGAHPRPWIAPEASPAAIVHRAPCPLRLAWDHGLRRLDDKLVWSMVEPSYFKHNQYLPELAPIVLGALVLTAYQTPVSEIDFVSEPVQSAQLLLRSATAMEWLLDELPSSKTELPLGAGLAISSYALTRLEMRGQ